MDEYIPEAQHKFSDNLFINTEENSGIYTTTSWFNFTTLALFARRYLLQYGETTHVVVKKEQFEALTKYFNNQALKENVIQQKIASGEVILLKTFLEQNEISVQDLLSIKLLRSHCSYFDLDDDPNLNSTDIGTKAKFYIFQSALIKYIPIKQINKLRQLIKIERKALSKNVLIKEGNK